MKKIALLLVVMFSCDAKRAAWIGLPDPESAVCRSGDGGTLCISRGRAYMCLGTSAGGCNRDVICAPWSSQGLGFVLAPAPADPGDRLSVAERNLSGVVDATKSTRWCSDSFDPACGVDEMGRVGTNDLGPREGL